MTAHFYDPFMVKEPRLRTGTSLNYKEHMFFEDIPKIPQEQKAFYDRVFAKEGDIFEGFMFKWALVKKLILKEIYKGLKKLETLTTLA